MMSVSHIRRTVSVDDALWAPYLKYLKRWNVFVPVASQINCAYHTQLFQIVGAPDLPREINEIADQLIELKSRIDVFKNTSQKIDLLWHGSSTVFGLKVGHDADIFLLYDPSAWTSSAADEYAKEIKEQINRGMRIELDLQAIPRNWAFARVDMFTIMDTSLMTGVPLTRAIYDEMWRSKAILMTKIEGDLQSICTKYICRFQKRLARWETKGGDIECLSALSQALKESLLAANASIYRVYFPPKILLEVSDQADVFANMAKERAYVANVLGRYRRKGKPTSEIDEEDEQEAHEFLEDRELGLNVIRRCADIVREDI